MTGRFRVTEDDFVGAMRLGSRMSAAHIVSYVIIAAVFAQFAVFTAGEISIVGAAALAAAVILVAGSRLVLAPLRWRKDYRQYPLFQQDVQVELLEEGLRLTSLHFTLMAEWRFILKWRENRHFVLVYAAPRLFYVLPKAMTVAAGEVGQLTAALARHIGPPS